MNSKVLTIVLFALSMVCCSEKEVLHNDAQSSFQQSREPFDDGSYELAVTKLNEFRTRFPYSRYATEAEILLADSHFHLGQYPEAVATYKQFIRLHPKHPKIPYAHFKVGESYWKDAPEAINREQYSARRALESWKFLVENFPSDENAKLAKPLLHEGQRRIAESEQNIAEFLCRKKQWAACAYRNMLIVDNSPQGLEDVVKEALLNASFALTELVKERANMKPDANIFFKDFSVKELEQKAESLLRQAKKIKMAS